MAEQGDIRTPLVLGRSVESPANGVTVLNMDLSAGGAFVPISAAKLTVEVGAITPRDSHEFAELWFVAQGEGQLTLDSMPTTIRAGEVIYLAPWSEHFVEANGTEELQIHSVWWRARGVPARRPEGASSGS